MCANGSLGEGRSNPAGGSAPLSLQVGTESRSASDSRTHPTGPEIGMRRRLSPRSGPSKAIERRSERAVSLGLTSF
jgi:hypothetical protein